MCIIQTYHVEFLVHASVVTAGLMASLINCISLGTGKSLTISIAAVSTYVIGHYIVCIRFHVPDVVGLGTVGMIIRRDIIQWLH